MARRSQTNEFHFEGFESPNTTPVPDVVFDRLLARLGEAELKALLYIVRRTFGFKRDRDPISFNQFLKGITTRDGRILDEGCGVRNRTTLSTALKSLEEKGIVISEKGTDERGENVTTIYRLRFKDGRDTSQRGIDGDDQGVVRQTYHRSTNSPPPVVRQTYPQETGLQQTDRHPSNDRMASADEKRKKPTTSSAARTPTSAGDVVKRLPLAEAVTRWQECQPGAGTQRTVAPPQQGNNDAAGPARQPAVPMAPRRGRIRQVPQQDEDYQMLQAYMVDFARELNDRAPLKASTTRLYNLLKRSGTDHDAFIAQLYAARAIVKERTSSIRSCGEDSAAGFPTRHKAAYFFAVLEDILGLRDEPPPLRH